MNLHEQFIQVEVAHVNLASRALQVAQLLPLPAGLTIDAYADSIKEGYLQDITTAAYEGGMTWLEAAELTLETVDTLIAELLGGTASE